MSGARAGRGHVPRVYIDRPLSAGDAVRLTGDKHHHLRTVLRLGEGDAVTLFDGGGGEYPAHVAESDKRALTLECGERAEPARESALRVVLGQAVARGDRMDYAIAKAVELGVAAIQPLLAERGKVRLSGERAARKHAHWQRVAISAAEQSGREIVPAVAAPQPLDTWLGDPPPGTPLILDPAAALTMRDLPLPAGAGVVVLVGPESGLSDEESSRAREAGFTGVGLGPRVLRTETAGVACLAAIQAIWGDLG